MASSTHFISLLFLITLFLALQVQAREKHFFSKVTPLNNNNKDIEPEASVTVTKHEQKPTFIPETQNNYGSYGQESSQLPPSTYTPTENAYEVDRFNKKDSYDNYYFNKDVYEANLKDPSNAKFTETSYNGMSNQKNKYYFDNNAANKFITERQGMSDTRFLEGGRYYYDINAEKYNPTMYGNYRKVDTRNWYDSNNNGYYVNNKNMYDNHKNMYQNQEEFEDDQDEFQP